MTKTIWIDVVTPADVRLFNYIMKDNPEHNYIITTRNGENYTELIELLDLFKIRYKIIGTYGENYYDKLIKHAERVKMLAEYIHDKNVDASIGLIAVDQARVSFGLKIRHFEINDMPYIGTELTPQAKLTSNIASKYIVPFYSKFNTPYKIDFLIQLLHLQDYKHKVKAFHEKENIIAIRDSEYLASYENFNDTDKTKEQKILEALYKEFGNAYTYILIPRYRQNIKQLQEKYKFATILDKAQDIIELYTKAKYFIGGGGTMNIEALFFNTNVISTRKFKAEYDEYLEDSIHYTRNIQEIIDIVATNKLKHNKLHTIKVNKEQLYKMLELK